MSFKVRDLMVTVIPAELERCLLHTRICVHPSECDFFSHVEICRLGCTQYQFPCSMYWTVCPGNVSAVIAPKIDPIVIDDVNDIAALRDELNQVLEQLDELEATGLDVLPRTAEGLAELEGKLQEALKAVQAQKTGGKKTGGKKTGGKKTGGKKTGGKKTK